MLCLQGPWLAKPELQAACLPQVIGLVLCSPPLWAHDSPPEDLLARPGMRQEEEKQKMSMGILDLKCGFLNECKLLGQALSCFSLGGTL